MSVSMTSIPTASRASVRPISLVKFDFDLTTSLLSSISLITSDIASSRLSALYTFIPFCLRFSIACLRSVSLPIAFSRACLSLYFRASRSGILPIFARCLFLTTLKAFLIACIYRVFCNRLKIPGSREEHETTSSISTPNEAVIQASVH